MPIAKSFFAEKDPSDAMQIDSRVVFDDLHPATRALCHRVKQRVTGYFSSYFDCADDALFQRVLAAEGQSERDKYNKSLNDLRFQREKVIESFIDHLETTLDQGADRFSEHPLLPIEQAGFDCAQAHLSRSVYGFGGDAEYEAHVAIEAMVAQAKHRCWEQVYYLDTRQHLFFNDKAPMLSAQRELDPIELCQLFHDMSLRFKLSVESRLLFYAIFERGVLRELNTMMRIANRWLEFFGVPVDEPVEKESDVRMAQEQSAILMLLDHLFEDAHQLSPEKLYLLTYLDGNSRRKTSIIRHMPTLDEQIMH